LIIIASILEAIATDDGKKMSVLDQKLRPEKYRDKIMTQTICHQPYK